VWTLQDSGGSGTQPWPEVALPAPSIVLFTPGGKLLLAGGSDGRLYQLDVSGAGAATPPSVHSVVLGDGGAAVGSPTLDTATGLVYVGSEAGTVYAVQIPLP